MEMTEWREEIACGKNSRSRGSVVGKDWIALRMGDGSDGLEHRTHTEEKWNTGLEGRWRPVY